MYRDYTSFLAESFKDKLNNNLYDFMNNKLSYADCSNLSKLYYEFVGIMKQTIDSHVPINLLHAYNKNCLNDHD